MPLTVLALDLEGTLVSNAVSQLPRPGLRAFLARCIDAVPQVVIFTAVSPQRTRAILERLAAEGDVAMEVAALPIVAWSGPVKDLRFLDAPAAACLLVDDLAAYVAPGQEDRWIPIDGWHAPYPEDDRELERVWGVIAGHLGG